MFSVARENFLSARCATAENVVRIDIYSKEVRSSKEILR